MKRNIRINFSITLILLFLLAVSSCKDEIDWKANEIEEIESFLQQQDMDISPKPSGLYYKDVVVGTGDLVQTLDTVEVYYSGFFLSGIKFDSNVSDPDPMRFVLQENSVGLIEGFQEAITYMREGGEAFVIIPSWLAYGTLGYGNIPGYTPLIFELELVKIDRASVAK